MKKSFQKMLLLLTLIIGSQLVSSAQNTCEINPDLAYLGSYFHTTVETVIQPVHYKGTDWLIAGGILGSTALVYANDQIIFDLFDRQMSPHQGEQFSKYTDAFGSGLLSVPLLGGMYLVGRSKDNCQLQEAALAGFQAFLLSAGAAYIVKSLSGRARPLSADDPYLWTGPFSGNDAFPSGHTARAFAVATVVSAYFPDNFWVGFGAYGLAALTASGRLLSGEHWPSDVVAGAALGYFVGRGVLYYHKKKKSKSSSAFQFEPQIGFDSLGLVVRF
ncbi:MAG: phosphatase PAP2 family protein [Bacteroidales bacterium]|nr:phosphatase PAP2 family protein [Bacteroidales bacterium]